MLPIKRRVNKTIFPEILKNGRFLYSPNFYLVFLDRKDSFPTLFSFIIPNKVIKNSVGRHSLKRKMSAIVEKLLITIKPGISALIFAKKDLSKAKYNEIEAEISKLLNKAF